MTRLTAPLALCLLATPLFAQDGTGSITGTLALDPARWVVASAGDGPTSSWSENDTGTKIHLVGTPQPDSDGGDGTLRITMDVQAGVIDARVTDARVELQRPDGTMVAKSENIDLTLEAFQETADSLAVAGSVFATLTPDPTTQLVIDRDEAVTLDGNFQATLLRSTDAPER